VSRFFNHAHEIFETAAAAGEDASELTILIHKTGQIHIMQGAEAPLDTLQMQHGYASAFRVSREAAGIRVEGRSGNQRCTLQADKPTPKNWTSAAAALGLTSDRPLYSLSAALALR
jgi:hypothetical protein